MPRRSASRPMPKPAAARPAYTAPPAPSAHAQTAQARGAAPSASARPAQPAQPAQRAAPQQQPHQQQQQPQQQQHVPAPAAASAPPAMAGSGAGVGSFVTGVAQIAAGSVVGHAVSGMLFGRHGESAPAEQQQQQAPPQQQQQQQYYQPPPPQQQQQYGAAPAMYDDSDGSGSGYANEDPCREQQMEFQRCLRQLNNDAARCNQFYQSLMSCQTAYRRPASGDFQF